MKKKKSESPTILLKSRLFSLFEKIRPLSVTKGTFDSWLVFV